MDFHLLTALKQLIQSFAFFKFLSENPVSWSHIADELFKIWFHSFIILLIKLLYSIEMPNGLFQKKSSIYFSETLPLEFLNLSLLPLEIPKKTRFHSYTRKFCRIVWHLLQMPRSKNKRPMDGNSTDSTWVFLKTPRNSTSFLVHRTLEFPHHALSFLQYSLKFHVLEPTFPPPTLVYS